MIKKEKRNYEHAKLDVMLNKALLNEKKWRNNE